MSALKCHWTLMALVSTQYSNYKSKIRVQHYSRDTWYKIMITAYNLYPALSEKTKYCTLHCLNGVAGVSALNGMFSVALVVLLNTL